jgi:hypothetical protein
MGTICGPPIANIFVYIYEKKRLYIHIPLIYYRYIDCLFLVIISPHGDALLKKLKLRPNACIILLLLLYIIGVFFAVNLKFKGQNSCVNFIKTSIYSREFIIF